MKKLSLIICLVLFLSAVNLYGDEKKADDEKSSYRVAEEIVYSNVGDEKLLLDAYVPSAEGKFPIALIIHGGAWRRGNRKQLSGYAHGLAAKGFCCFAIDYRLAPEHKFPAQIEDCRAAVKWIRENAEEYKADPTRLAAVGYSAGGHLATLLGTTGAGPSDDNGNADMRIQAVVAGGAPTDFRWLPDQGEWAKYWMGGNLKTVPEKFHQASSTAFVDAKDPPTFFFHGEKDSTVPLIWAGQCHVALKKVGVETQMHVVKGAGHIQAAKDSEALTKAFDFLARELLVPVIEEATK